MTAESPCISVCQLDGAKTYCVGCLRTVSEIAAWPHLTEVQKILLLAIVQKRKAALSVPAAVSGGAKGN